MGTHDTEQQAVVALHREHGAQRLRGERACTRGQREQAGALSPELAHLVELNRHNPVHDIQVIPHPLRGAQHRVGGVDDEHEDAEGDVDDGDVSPVGRAPRPGLSQCASSRQPARERRTMTP